MSCEHYRGSDRTYAARFVILRALQGKHDWHLDDIQNVLNGERLEVEAAGGVVIRRHCLWVAVEHDRLEPSVPAAATTRYSATAHGAHRICTTACSLQSNWE